MAKIIYGLGTSHGPLLHTPPDYWYLRGEDDKNNDSLAYRDGTYAWQALYELRKTNGEDFEEQIQDDVKVERYARCQKALDDLAAKLAEVDPDVLVMVGDDQKEWFRTWDATPCFAVFHGEEVVNTAFKPDEGPPQTKSFQWSRRANHPDEDVRYPIQQDLALKIIEQAIDDGIDVSAMAAAPRDGGVAPRFGQECTQPGKIRGIGHAFSFIGRRLMKDHRARLFHRTPWIHPHRQPADHRRPGHGPPHHRRRGVRQ